MGNSQNSWLESSHDPLHLVPDRDLLLVVEAETGDVYLPNRAETILAQKFERFKINAESVLRLLDLNDLPNIKHRRIKRGLPSLTDSGIL